MFRVQCYETGGCEVRMAFTEPEGATASANTGRAFVRLHPSLTAVNVWLATLAVAPILMGRDGAPHETTA